MSRDPRSTSDNRRMLGRLAVVVALMFGFGYLLVPMYRTICTALGINVLTVSEDRNNDGIWGGAGGQKPSNSQVDLTRTITVEFDANVSGPWEFSPEQRSVQVHPGQLTTVMYRFRNTLARPAVVQAIPSYAPRVAAEYFKKVECFCFTQHTLAAGEAKRWPVVFVVDTGLPRDVHTITLSYTFFEVGGRMPAAPDT
ncbi:MAG: cytochrome c oxidase assembly protein [Burkholderiales bacterium]|nr:cytochrome c oxidase assembly protein [Burkholderiales bacterium]MDE1927844.1 cytochrome c oxidase assembly protein [Burkholderiales bacterium]MDE2158898.1 cytochrome c oxidase assembly protein [Burkholderiales bacterium]MDE2503317.1 cytochrome c oxidase assembly protein [Burkholderiales bacterium]